MSNTQNMAKIMSLLVLEALFCFAFIPLCHSSDSLIESTCQQTSYYDLCIYTLQSDPRSSTMGLHGLARVAGNGLNETAADNLDLVSELLGSTNNPKLNNALKVCIGSYNTIIKVDVPGAIEAAQRNNPNLAIDYTRDAEKQVETCEKSFGENEIESPISAINTVAHQLIVILQSIVTIIL
ncbi:hypothetical protein V6N13_022834 [Hibiscus sabdariffa]|uniref:Pectinesterase inhibitor domain-containing protein n=1 Tax=Hibiscus sabdariffa TaxID=183260 RepID=A0ABR2BDQ4_9ROSI